MSVKVTTHPKAHLDMRVYRAKEGKWIDLKRISLSSRMARLLQRLKGK